MKEYDFDKGFKLYKRFLKENGIYTRTMHIHQYDVLTCHKKTKNIYNLFLEVPISEWIINNELFCRWSRTPEGRKLWLRIHILWKFCLIENGYKIPLNVLSENVTHYCNEFRCDAKLLFGEKLKLLSK